MPDGVCDISDSPDCPDVFEASDLQHRIETCPLHHQQPRTRTRRPPRRRRADMVRLHVYRHLKLLIVPLLIIAWVFLPSDVLRKIPDFFNHVAYRITKPPPNILDNVDIDCQGIKNADPAALLKFENYSFDHRSMERYLLLAPDRCLSYRYVFGFNERTLSQEEADYPLAYGILTYKNPVQVLLMLASFYHPQNEYCIAISGTANPAFNILMESLRDCYPNIHIMQVGPVKWGGFEIIESVHKCMQHLSALPSQWRYFQYLSGVDVPLRTNLEMVQAFKAMGGAVNVEIKEYSEGRLRNKTGKPPLPLFKSSLSALVPREAADRISEGGVVQQLLHFLRGTSIADEGFWGTVLANPMMFPLPGGFDGEDWLAYDAATRNRTKPTKTTKKARSLQQYLRPMWRYYVSRYQQWGQPCFGRLSAGSCVFGVKSVPILLQQPHFVAHKLYIDYQPAAFLCLLKAIRDRSANPVDFDVSNYTLLPQVELSQGLAFANLSRPHWIF